MQAALRVRLVRQWPGDDAPKAAPTSAMTTLADMLAHVRRAPRLYQPSLLFFGFLLSSAGTGRRPVPPTMPLSFCSPSTGRRT